MSYGTAPLMSHGTAPLRIPPFYCPVPPSLHPEVELISHRAIDWLRGYGLFPTPQGLAYLRGSHFPEMACRFFPDGDTDRVQVMADFVQWTLYDDVAVDGNDFPGLRAGEGSGTAPRITSAGQLAEVAGKLLRMLEVPGADLLPPDPWVESLMAVRDRIALLATPAQTQRWIAAVREYLLATCWKRDLHHRRRLPSLADYLTLRTPDGGVQMYVAMSEIIGGYRLTDDDLARPEVRALKEMACAVIAWDNDLFSHYKETLTESPCINLIDVIAAERRCPAQAAVTEAVALRDRVMLRYTHLADSVLPSLDASQRRYVTDLGRCIAANIDMSAGSLRYINPLNGPPDVTPWADFHPVRTDTPSTTDPRPLPYSDLAAWW
ncbi:hypothetical protein ACFRMQ_05105 [Kitasatospora sp. NPDC056783]|uniref:terpene synthase family protein n=1 Tax=Kitasatospora sp. NPDC056783 TaxID=3345943 RepID=UPI0036A4C1F6